MTNRGNVPTTLDNIRKHRNLDKHGMSHDLYQAYLRSQHWIVTKQEFYNSELFNGECGYCKDRFKKYHVHHKNYSKIGEEPLTHLIALCPKCHNDVHRFLYRNKGVSLENALDKMKESTSYYKEVDVKDTNINPYKLENLYKLPIYRKDKKARKRIKRFFNASNKHKKRLLSTWKNKKFISSQEKDLMNTIYLQNK